MARLSTIPHERKPRPSSIPLLMACPPSHQNDGISIEATDGNAADAGRKLHTLMAGHIDGVPYPELAARAEFLQRSNPIYADATFLVREGIRLFEQHRHYFLVRHNGTLLQCPDFEGTPDVVSIEADVIAVGDWKFGYGWADAYHQVMSYLYLLNHTYPGRTRFYAFVYLVRFGVVERFEADQQSLADWHAQYREAAESIHGTAYRINKGCENCRRVLFCPAIKAACSTMAVLGALNNPHDNSPAGNLELTRDALKALSRVQQAVDTATDAMVASRGGSFTLPSGRALRRVIQWRKRYNPAKALPILREILGPRADQIAEITGAGIKRAIAEAMPGRRVGEVMTAILERLAAADAVQEYPTTRLVTGEPERTGDDE